MARPSLRADPCGPGRGLGLEAPDFDTFWQRGELTLPQKDDDGGILRAFRHDPVGAPLATPSGKVQISSPGGDLVWLLGLPRAPGLAASGLSPRPQTPAVAGGQTSPTPSCTASSTLVPTARPANARAERSWHDAPPTPPAPVASTKATSFACSMKWAPVWPVRTCAPTCARTWC